MEIQKQGKSIILNLFKGWDYHSKEDDYKLLKKLFQRLTKKMVHKL